DVTGAQVEELHAVLRVGDGEVLGVLTLPVAGLAQDVGGGDRQRALVGHRDAQRAAVGAPVRDRVGPVGCCGGGRFAVGCCGGGRFAVGCCVGVGAGHEGSRF